MSILPRKTILAQIKISRCWLDFCVLVSVCKSGPVRFFGPKLKDRDRDRSTFILELKKTGPVIRLSVAGREQQLNKMRICAYGVSTDDSTGSSKTETGNTTHTTQ